MPPEDEIPESVEDQEELTSFPIEDEIWEPVLESLESAFEPDQDEIPEPPPEPAEDEIPAPISAPAVAVPIPPATEASAPVEKPEPVSERVEIAPAEPEPPPARKTLLKFPHKKSHWIFYPLYLLLLLLIGYLGFQAVQAIQIARLGADALAASGPEAVRPDVQPRASIRPLSDYQVIWQRNLFNVIPAKDSEKKEEISLDKIALAKKDLGLELVGTVVADNPNLSRAIIDNRKTREQEAYREGEAAGKVKIKKILRNNVIITTADGDELLTVEIKESGKRVNPSADAQASPAISKSSAGEPGGRPPVNNPWSFRLARQEVEASLADAQPLLQEVNLDPYLKDDEPAGFKITNIASESVLKKIGLENDDVISALNEEAVTGPEQAADFFQKIAEGGEFKITIERNRRLRFISLNIQ
jgi:general secretion pathway protein C